MSIKEKEWPIDVFRRTAQGQWQKQVPITTTENDAGQNYLESAATAIPKKDCIVIKRFRLRISLVRRKNNPKQPSNSRSPVSQHGLLEVVRRGPCLLLSAKTRLRALVLKFVSIRECLEFSDHLLSLNPSLNLRAQAAAPVERDEPNNKSLVGMLGTNENEEHYDDVSTSQAVSVQLQTQRNDVYSYVVRLLQDKDFRKFVDKVEDTILASSDGAQILLDALQRHDSSRTHPNQGNS